ncbi:hypothetical protein [Paenibacillus xanthanilyticus]|uniref:Uncharacterized protein n=1 Tax=Paenibacillus xanthanilyticus TaxID=1783531 RepID=A0ABV8KC54_9BACL
MTKKFNIVPFADLVHKIRYVRTPDNLVYATLLNRPATEKFVCQASFFVRVTGISPRSTLGSVEVSNAQLAALGFIPRKEVAQYVDADVVAVG